MQAGKIQCGCRSYHRLWRGLRIRPQPDHDTPVRLPAAHGPRPPVGLEGEPSDNAGSISEDRGIHFRIIRRSKPPPETSFHNPIPTCRKEILACLVLDKFCRLTSLTWSDVAHAIWRQALSRSSLCRPATPVGRGESAAGW